MIYFYFSGRAETQLCFFGDGRRGGGGDDRVGSSRTAVSPSMSSRFSSDCGEAGATTASSSGAMASSANAGGATGGGSATAMSASMIVPWCTSEPGESSPPAFGDAATSGASSTTIASAASAGASFMSTSIARRGAGRSPTLAPWSTARLRARAPPPSLDGI